MIILKDSAHINQVKILFKTPLKLSLKYCLGNLVQYAFSWSTFLAFNPLTRIIAFNYYLFNWLALIFSLVFAKSRKPPMDELNLGYEGQLSPWIVSQLVMVTSFLRTMLCAPIFFNLARYHIKCHILFRQALYVLLCKMFYSFISQLSCLSISTLHYWSFEHFPTKHSWKSIFQGTSL